MQRRGLTILCLMTALAVWSGVSRAQQPQYGGTLRIALPGDVTFFNAHQGSAPGSHTAWVANNIFNSLVTLTPPP